MAAFFGARAGPSPALAPGPAAPAWPWNLGPRARTKKMQPPTPQLGVIFLNIEKYFSTLRKKPTIMD